MTNIENEAKGYQDLIDEIEVEQQRIIKQLRYTLTGVIGGRQLSDQEYQVFVERALTMKPFGDIAYNMGITESTAKTYFERATKKLAAEASRLKAKLEDV
jgi:DNA-binding CsgD family transcriptional regulator